MNPSERTAHPSAAQVEVLLEFLIRNPELAKGFSRTQSARDKTRTEWQQLSEKLNSLGRTLKSWQQWVKYWRDKKSAVKKKAAVRTAARKRTGGGVGNVVELSEVDEKILSLMGGETFATGDAHLRIQPFHESSQLAHRHRTAVQSPYQRSTATGLATPRRRRTRQMVQSSPPSQRRSQFSSITDRFLRVEEQRLAVEKANTEILQRMIEQNAERDRMLAEALKSVSDGLKALAEALKH